MQTYKFKLSNNKIVEIPESKLEMFKGLYNSSEYEEMTIPEQSTVAPKMEAQTKQTVQPSQNMPEGEYVIKLKDSNKKIRLYHEAFGIVNTKYGKDSYEIISSPVDKRQERMSNRYRPETKEENRNKWERLSSDAESFIKGESGRIASRYDAVIPPSESFLSSATKKLIASGASHLSILGGVASLGRDILDAVTVKDVGGKETLGAINEELNAIQSTLYRDSEKLSGISKTISNAMGGLSSSLPGMLVSDKLGTFGGVALMTGLRDYGEQTGEDYRKGDLEPNIALKILDSTAKGVFAGATERFIGKFANRAGVSKALSSGSRETFIKMLKDEALENGFKRALKTSKPFIKGGVMEGAQEVVEQWANDVYDVLRDKDGSYRDEKSFIDGLARFGSEAGNNFATGTVAGLMHMPLSVMYSKDMSNNTEAQGKKAMRDALKKVKIIDNGVGDIGLEVADILDKTDAHLKGGGELTSDDVLTAFAKIDKIQNSDIKEQAFKEFENILKRNGVNVSDIKKQPPQQEGEYTPSDNVPEAVKKDTAKPTYEIKGEASNDTAITIKVVPALNDINERFNSGKDISSAEIDDIITDVPDIEDEAVRFDILNYARELKANIIHKENVLEEIEYNKKEIENGNIPATKTLNLMKKEARKVKGDNIVESLISEIDKLSELANNLKAQKQPVEKPKTKKGKITPPSEIESAEELIAPPRVKPAELVEGRQPEKLTEKIVGKETEREFKRNERTKGNLAVVELDNIQPSHIYGERNEYHKAIAKAQDKERTVNDTYVARKNAKEKDPAFLLIDTEDPYNGAITVNSRGEVIQGNNRTESIGFIYGEFADTKGKEYKDVLISKAKEMGFSDEQIVEIKKLKKPTMVFRADVDDAEAIRLGNFKQKDRETGGVEYISPKATWQKLDNLDKDRFIAKVERWLQESETSTLREIAKSNSPEIVKFLSSKGAVSPEEVKGFYNEKSGNVSSTGGNLLTELLAEAVLTNTSIESREKFLLMPDRAQNALLKLNILSKGELLNSNDNIIEQYTNYRNSSSPNWKAFISEIDIEGKDIDDKATPTEQAILQIISKSEDKGFNGNIKSFLSEFNSLINPDEDVLFGEDGEIGKPKKAISVLDAIKRATKDNPMFKDIIIPEPKNIKGVDEVKKEKPITDTKVEKKPVESAKMEAKTEDTVSEQPTIKIGDDTYPTFEQFAKTMDSKTYPYESLPNKKRVRIELPTGYNLIKTSQKWGEGVRISYEVMAKYYDRNLYGGIIKKNNGRIPAKQEDKVVSPVFKTAEDAYNFLIDYEMMREEELSVARVRPGMERKKSDKQILKENIKTIYGSEMKMKSSLREINSNSINDAKSFIKTNKDNKVFNEIISSYKKTGKYTAIEEGLVEAKPIQIKGAKIESVEDIYRLLHIYRSPKIEKTHILYLDDNNVVVGNDMTTANHIATTYGQSLNNIMETAKKLGATSYYRVHNHPSGVVKASLADIDVYYMSCVGVDDKDINVTYKGDIIMNHNKYGFLDPDRYSKELEVYDVEVYQTANISKNFYKEKLLLNDKTDAFRIGKVLSDYNENSIPVIFFDAKMKINSVVSTPIDNSPIFSNTIAHAIDGLNKNAGANSIVFIPITEEEFGLRVSGNIYRLKPLLFEEKCLTLIFSDKKNITIKGIKPPTMKVLTSPFKFEQTTDSYILSESVKTFGNPYVEGDFRRELVDKVKPIGWNVTDLDNWLRTMYNAGASVDEKFINAEVKRSIKRDIKNAIAKTDIREVELIDRASQEVDSAINIKGKEITDKEKGELTKLIDSTYDRIKKKSRTDKSINPKRTVNLNVYEKYLYNLSDIAHKTTMRTGDRRPTALISVLEHGRRVIEARGSIILDLVNNVKKEITDPADEALIGNYIQRIGNWRDILLKPKLYKATKALTQQLDSIKGVIAWSRVYDAITGALVPSNRKFFTEEQQEMIESAKELFGDYYENQEEWEQFAILVENQVPADMIEDQFGIYFDFNAFVVKDYLPQFNTMEEAKQTALLEDKSIEESFDEVKRRPQVKVGNTRVREGKAKEQASPLILAGMTLLRADRLKYVDKPARRLSKLMRDYLTDKDWKMLNRNLGHLLGKYESDWANRAFGFLASLNYRFKVVPNFTLPVKNLTQNLIGATSPLDLFKTMGDMVMPIDKLKKRFGDDILYWAKTMSEQKSNIGHLFLFRKEAQEMIERLNDPDKFEMNDNIKTVVHFLSVAERKTADSAMYLYVKSDEFNRTVALLHHLTKVADAWENRKSINGFLDKIDFNMLPIAVRDAMLHTLDTKGIGAFAKEFAYNRMMSIHYEYNKALSSLYVNSDKIAFRLINQYKAWQRGYTMHHFRNIYNLADNKEWRKLGTYLLTYIMELLIQHEFLRSIFGEWDKLIAGSESIDDFTNRTTKALFDNPASYNFSTALPPGATPYQIKKFFGGEGKFSDLFKDFALGATGSDVYQAMELSYSALSNTAGWMSKDDYTEKQRKKELTASNLDNFIDMFVQHFPFVSKVVRGVNAFSDKPYWKATSGRLLTDTFDSDTYRQDFKDFYQKLTYTMFNKRGERYKEVKPAEIKFKKVKKNKDEF